MKFIQAVIQPHHLTAVLAALERVAVERLTVLDAHTSLPPDVIPGHTAARQHAPQVFRRIVVEIVVNDDFLERTVEALAESARTGPGGRDGDGKIFVLPVDEAIQIGGFDRGPGAV